MHVKLGFFLGLDDIKQGSLFVFTVQNVVFPALAHVSAIQKTEKKVEITQGQQLICFEYFKPMPCRAPQY